MRGSGVLESGGASASTSMSARERGADRCGGHVRGHGGRDGSGGHQCGGGCGRGRPRKKKAVDEGDPPVLNFPRGHRYGFLTLAQTADAVCPYASDSRRNTSPADADPAADDYGKFQGTINFPPPHNYSDCGTIRDELDRLIVYATSN